MGDERWDGEEFWKNDQHSQLKTFTNIARVKRNKTRYLENDIKLEKLAKETIIRVEYDSKGELEYEKGERTVTGSNNNERHKNR